ncbi:MAG TPA: rRNA adenine N-6-methyltransferase family protein [Alphaproteobacteria bacterium]|nr:rRNA adenine N-6-methyltransferase family protein [Alphaproteobacteria bacterium]
MGYKDLFDDNLDKTGQHYMVDSELVKFIVKSALLNEKDVVLEIGYGTGVLTRVLAKKCKVIGIDIEGKSDEIKNSTFVDGNILDKYWELKEKYKFNKIVSNIPYNISEPLMKEIFKDDLDLVVLTVGSKFAKIISSTDNRIGIMASDIFDVQVLKSVNPSSFNPRPKVDSSVVRLVPKRPEDSVYKKLVRYDDLKLRNAFIKIFTDKTKNQIKEFTQSKIFDKKLYELSNKEFVELDKMNF